MMNYEISQQLLTRLSRSVAASASYLYGTQSDNGGFCFFKYQYFEQPNLRDTYHAIAALRLCGLKVPRVAEIVQFLHAQKKDDVASIYYCACAFRELGAGSLAVPELMRIHALSLPRAEVTSETDADRWLERIFQILFLQRCLGVESDAAGVRLLIGRFRSHTGYGDNDNIRETWLRLKIFSLLEIDDVLPYQATKDFVDSLQRDSTGFTDRPNSQYSNLEVIAAGMQCCLFLDVPVRYAEESLSFVLACQSADGSFSRVPVALPDIALTHRALQIIGWTVPELLGDGNFHV
jgi:hypothetical protein